MPLCQEIASDGCERPVEAGWNFCAHCGHRLASLRFGAAVGGGTEAAGTIAVPIGKSGLSPVRLGVRVSDNAGGRVRRVSAPESVTADARLVVEYEGADAVPHEALIVWSSDATKRTRENLWEPEALGSEQPLPRLPIARKSAPRVVAEPAILPLSGRTRKREFDLVNLGGVAAEIRAPFAPQGYRIVGRDGASDGITTLYENGGRASFTVERLDDAAPSARVAVQDPIGGELAALELLSIPASGASELPSYYVGIDFGTSNTSVVVFDTFNGGHTMLPYPHRAAGAEDPLRWPTVLYMDGGPSTWKYGYEAELNVASSTADRIVRELKSALREEPMPRFGPQSVEALTLTAWYFERLLSEVVEPYLDRVEPGSRPSVGFVLSLPVLDGEGGPLFGRQRDRTLAAFRAALAGTDLAEHATVATVQEPVAAATFMLHRYQTGEMQLGAVTLATGDLIGVFDSGGGTTDVVLFSVDLSQKPIGMRNPRQFGTTSFVPKDPQEGTEPVEQPFGGEVVTRELGIRIARRCKKPEDLNFLPNVIASEGIRAKFDHFDDAYSLIEDRDGVMHIVRDPSLGPETGSWTWRFGGLRRRISGLKPLLSGDANEVYERAADGTYPTNLRIDITKSGDKTVAPAIAEENFRIQPADFDETMQAHLPAIVARIDELAREGGDGELKGLIAVGGNTRLEPMMRRLRDRYGRRLLMDDDAVARGHAVALGTVYALAAGIERPPYALELRSPEGRRLSGFRPDQILASGLSTGVYEIPAESSLTFDLLLGASSPTTLARQVRIVNTTTTPERVRVSAGVESSGASDRRFVVRTESKEGAREHLSWPL